MIFAIPIFVYVPELPPAPRSRQGRLLRELRGSRAETSRASSDESRHTFWFLVASAVYRDGLAGVFAFGAIIASGTFGFEFLEVVASESPPTSWRA